MKDGLKKHIRKDLAPLFETITYPIAYVSAKYMRTIRRICFDSLPHLKKLMMNTGVFPIIDQYYEPMFHPKHLRFPLKDKRNLPGIDLNVEEQLQLLRSFNYADELIKIPLEKPTGEMQYFFNNPSYRAADGGYLYSMIRHFKPSRIIEVGSGYSTLMAIKAIDANKNEERNYTCIHECIEPYEMPWLEKTSATIIRKKLEDLDLSVFEVLGENDMLIIDSSHVIRPQGDVLTEYLEILPSLRPGVIIHIHDIFTPRDYPDEWVRGVVRFWNEQYLLESMLSGNERFEILGALNYLKNDHYDELKKRFPMISNDCEPGAFWIRKK